MHTILFHMQAVSKKYTTINSPNSKFQSHSGFLQQSKQQMAIIQIILQQVNFLASSSQVDVWSIAPLKQQNYQADNVIHYFSYNGIHRFI